MSANHLNERKTSSKIDQQVAPCHSKGEGRNSRGRFKPQARNMATTDGLKAQDDWQHELGRTHFLIVKLFE